MSRANSKKNKNKSSNNNAGSVTSNDSSARELRRRSVTDSNSDDASNHDTRFAMIESNIEKLSAMMEKFLLKQEEVKEPTSSKSNSAVTPSIVQSSRLNSPVALPAAIEDKVQLPEPPKLIGKTITPEAFTEWKLKIKDIIEAFPRYRPILFHKPEDGWPEFIRLNSKFNSVDLEEHYLNAHRSLWAFITSCFSSTTVLQLTDEMQSDLAIHCLPRVLNFQVVNDSTFYKDCYSLMEKLTERFQMKSGWRVSNLMKQLISLQYRYGTDPSVFIQEYHSIQRQLKTLVPKYQIQDDEVQAYELLTKLPKELDSLRTQFLNPEQPPTVEAVEGALRSWWQSDKANKGNHRTPGGPPHSANSVTPATYGKKKFKNKKKGNPHSNNSKGDNNDSTPNDQSTDQSFVFPVIQTNSAPKEGVSLANSGLFMPQSRHILFDSGASIHITGRRDALEDEREIPPLKVSTIVGDRTIKISGKLKINSRVSLKHVKYLPNATYSLLSIGQVCNTDSQVLFTKDGAYILPPKTIPVNTYKKSSILSARREGNLYVYNLGNKPEPETKGDFEHNPNPVQIPKRPIEQKSIPESQSARQSLTESRKLRSNTSTNSNNASNTHSSVAASIVEDTASVENEDYSDDDSIPTEFVGTIIAIPTEVAKHVPVETKSIGLQTKLGIIVDSNAVNLHTRLGHLGVKHLNLTNQHYGLGISKESIEYYSNCNCNICISCKSKRTTIGNKTAAPSRVAQSIMDCWHVDLIGPFSMFDESRRLFLPSLDGKIYGLVIVDEYSRYVMTYPLQKKSEATQALIKLIKLRQTSTGIILKRIHSDGGGEFINKQLQTFLTDQGTELTTTTPNTPRLNGIVERMNQTLATMVRCMLHHANAPQELWSHAYLYATHIHNRVCQPSIQGKVPAELIFPSQSFSLDKIHVFGCDAHVLIEESKRGKLQQRTLPGVFIGFNEQYNSYKILMLNNLEVKASRDVKFNESSFVNLDSIRSKISTNAQQSSTIEDKEYEVEYIEDEQIRNEVQHYKVYWKGYRYPTWEPISNLTNCDNLFEEYQSRKQSTQHALTVVVSDIDSQSVANYIIPQSYNEALKHPDKDKWRIAIEEELNSLQHFNTFTPSILPNGRKPIDCRWVFAVKRDVNNKIIRWKARLVVKGFKQQEGIDFFETFSPTVKIKSIKYILGIAAHEDLEIKQLDFDTAFLNANLTEDIYVSIPQGYKNNSNYSALRLNKALYGLKQAPREWWLELDASLKSLGYTSSPLDECLYVKVVNQQRIYLAVYVDDTIAAYPKALESVWLTDKAKIANKYAIKDLGNCEWILHMAVVRDRNNKTITLSQQSYIQTMLEKFNMNNCKSASNPFWITDLSVPPQKIEPCLLNEEEHSEYRSIVGSMLYAAIITRIDITYIVSVLTRYLSKPYNYHLIAAKHVLRYLHGTMDKKLTFGPSNSNSNSYNLTIYTDSNWANEKFDRKSTGGYVTLLNGYPIAWQSKKQSTIALSSTEAEYYALGDAVREALFIRQWFEFYCGQLIPIHIKCDNQGALHIADHSTNHNRTKHIDIQHYFVREHVKNNSILLSYVNTQDQLADILTKATTLQVFNRLIHKLFPT
jgi:Reverse transcriptase (RNA-dependent DNA polymerase)/Integrase core domain/Chromo (CHRromatin Organisation MOdifier) domain/gag-polypeptide of LTR copia-type